MTPSEALASLEAATVTVDAEAQRLCGERDRQVAGLLTRVSHSMAEAVRVLRSAEPESSYDDGDRSWIACIEHRQNGQRSFWHGAPKAWREGFVAGPQDEWRDSMPTATRMSKDDAERCARMVGLLAYHRWAEQPN